MCSGATFEKHKAMRKAVDVNGFHNLLNTMRKVKVVTEISSINLDGETIIYVFNEFLWFSDTIDHSLLPPIQL